MFINYFSLVVKFIFNIFLYLLSIYYVSSKSLNMLKNLTYEPN